MQTFQITVLFSSKVTNVNKTRDGVRYYLTQAGLKSASWFSYCRDMNRNNWGKPGAIGVQALTMNRSVPCLCPAGDLCCMSVPISLLSFPAISPTSLSNKGTKCPENNYIQQKETNGCMESGNNNIKMN